MNRVNRPIAAARFTLLFLSVPLLAAGDDPRSDEQKKETVYRMYREYKENEFPGVADLTPGEANALLEAGKVVFVDTRDEAEMKVSTLPGAIPREEFLDDPDAWTDKIVVAYCTISFRSGILAKKLAERGIPVFNLRGGILAWTLEGYDVYDSEGETRRIHVYGDDWNHAPAGYDTGEFGWFRRLF